MTTKGIVVGLESGDKSTIEYVYEQYFQMIRRLVTDNSGSNRDAEDVFQDTMIVLYEKIRKGTLSVTGAFSTFLYSIARNIWLKHIAKRTIIGRLMYDPEHPVMNEACIDVPIEQQRIELFRKHFETLSPQKQQVLKLYFEGWSEKRIAKEVGITSLKYMKKLKDQCRKMLTKRVQDDPSYNKTIFTDSEGASEGVSLF